MSKSTTVSGMLAVEASHADVAVHTVHDDGQLSIRLTGELHHFPVYLHGTPDQLHALADKLRAIATAHESQTTLAGGAAQEAVNGPLRGSFDAWLVARGWVRDRLTSNGLETLRKDWADEMSQAGR